MTLRLVGAGLGRTGTASLKAAIERLTGQPCYHMMEVFGHPEHLPIWHGAMTGASPDWDTVFAGYGATVDWPGAAVWADIAAAYPDAKVLLSTRASAEAWWKSADRTIFEPFRGVGSGPMGPPEWEAMATAMLTERFTARFLDASEAMAAYERHNAEVRASVPTDRLVEWQPGDGWKPLADALGVDVPDEPFPHTNSTEEFRARAGFDADPVQPA